jgi:hypothetical protein
MQSEMIEPIKWKCSVTGPIAQSNHDNDRFNQRTLLVSDGFDTTLPACALAVAPNLFPVPVCQSRPEQLMLN